MITTGRDPLHVSFLLEFCKEPSIEPLAARHVTLLTMNRVVTHQVHVLLKCMMHESKTVLLASVASASISLVRLLYHSIWSRRTQFMPPEPMQSALPVPKNHNLASVVF